MANSFSAEELKLLVRYQHIDDLLQKLRLLIIEPAVERVGRIKEGIAKSEAILLVAPTSSTGV